MGTYYMAQLGIALSVVNSHKATVRVELDSEVIDIDTSEASFYGHPSPLTTTTLGMEGILIGTGGGGGGGRRVKAKANTPRHVGWGNMGPSSFDSDDDELTLPKTRFSSK